MRACVHLRRCMCLGEGVRSLSAFLVSYIFLNTVIVCATLVANLLLAFTLRAVVITQTVTSVCSHVAHGGNLFFHFAFECMCGRIG